MRTTYLTVQVQPTELPCNSRIHSQSPSWASTIKQYPLLALQIQMDLEWKHYLGSSFFGEVQIHTQSTPILQLGQDHLWDIHIHLMARAMPFPTLACMALCLAHPIHITIIMLDPLHLVFLLTGTLVSLWSHQKLHL